MNKKTKITTVAFAAIMVFSMAAFSKVDRDTLDDKLQNILDSGIKFFKVRGVSAAIVFPDYKIWTGVSGFSHGSVPIKPGMLFAIGSITKNMVAALTMKLVEEKILTLGDPLSKWLPHYKNVDGSATIRQLLNHSSGIYMFWSNQKIWDDLKKDRKKIWAPEEILHYLKEPYFKPGKGFRYSNTNYLLLAMIITKVTRSNLSTQFRKRFWNPMGIKNAFYSIEENTPDNLAHVWGDNFTKDGSNIDLTFLPRNSHDSITHGSGGLLMTAEALARWCHALFRGKVLQEKSMAEMLTFVQTGSRGNMSGYGLGVQLFRTRFTGGKKAIGHSGANIGTIAYMVYLPDQRFSFVVMVNGSRSKCCEFIINGLIRVVTEKS